KTENGFVEGKKRFQLCFVRNFPRGRSELRIVCTFRKWIAPVSGRKTGASASTETVDVDLVADIYPAEAGHPSPAAGSDPRNRPRSHGPNGRDGQPWLRTLAYGHHEDRTPTHGYAATREAVMAVFANSWRRE